MRFTKRQNFTVVFLAIALLLALHDNESEKYSETGRASYYAYALGGSETASGEIYYHDSLTAAHRTIPFGTLLEVENLDNNKSVVVRVNDRAPFVEERIIDLSRAAFEKIASLEEGVVEVKITEVGK
ncbi:septal ring lytic transglycosylase RlpA family protein [Anaerophaga thermohalophila]|jgi:rare lipoprotein A|uniref:septal ring lytic transglycosylase RlpA family protein n=1 Tax=Anaerophaga thermohalophila TaxID=177400 RepID=UPI000303F4AB|nr:septal ring lytic transglycosylase RlpA family protein [Anaerophaga thermohalophila]